MTERGGASPFTGWRGDMAYKSNFTIRSYDQSEKAVQCVQISQLNRQNYKSFSR